MVCRGQTVDLSPHGRAVIYYAEDSGLARGRRRPPHRDNDYFHRRTREEAIRDLQHA